MAELAGGLEYTELTVRVVQWAQAKAEDVSR
jgi:hypothetical protein